MGDEGNNTVIISNYPQLYVHVGEGRYAENSDPGSVTRGETSQQGGKLLSQSMNAGAPKGMSQAGLFD